MTDYLRAAENISCVLPWLCLPLTCYSSAVANLRLRGTQQENKERELLQGRIDSRAITIPTRFLLLLPLLSLAYTPNSEQVTYFSPLATLRREDALVHPNPLEVEVRGKQSAKAISFQLCSNSSFYSVLSWLSQLLCFRCLFSEEVPCSSSAGGEEEVSPWSPWFRYVLRSSRYEADITFVRSIDRSIDRSHVLHTGTCA